MLEAFNALQTKTHIELEHPTLTHLHRSLVLEGNYVTAESIMAEAGVSGLFMDYINEAQYHPIWRRIHSTDSSMFWPTSGQCLFHIVCRRRKSRNARWSSNVYGY